VLTKTGALSDAAVFRYHNAVSPGVDQSQEEQSVVCSVNEYNVLAWSAIRHCVLVRSLCLVRLTYRHRIDVAQMTGDRTVVRGVDMTREDLYPPNYNNNVGIKFSTSLSSTIKLVIKFKWNLYTIWLILAVIPHWSDETDDDFVHGKCRYTY